MQWLKDLWSKWKVHITVVGGAVVIVTAYRQCSITPDLGGLLGDPEIEESSDDADAEVGEVSATGEETDAAITPLSARVAEINTELLNALDTEAGINHGGEAEACPA